LPTTARTWWPSGPGRSTGCAGHLHELDPGWDPKPRSLTRRKNLAAVAVRLASLDGMVARIAADLADRIAMLTTQAGALEKEIAARVRQLAPSLLALRGVAELTAANIVAETAGVDRFRSKDAYARHNGTAPLPVWSGSGTGWRAPATGSSTARSTGSPSPRNAGTPTPRPT
jgi:transposase